MATTLEIIRGISQAAANAYDGSHDERYTDTGYAKEVGLKREQGDCITDSRVMDGFKVRISGPKLIVTYQSEMPMSAFHNTKLDQSDHQRNPYAERRWSLRHSTSKHV